MFLVEIHIRDEIVVRSIKVDMKMLVLFIIIKYHKINHIIKPNIILCTINNIS